MLACATAGAHRQPIRVFAQKIAADTVPGKWWIGDCDLALLRLRDPHARSSMWSVDQTDSFEETVVLAVNLGDDSPAHAPSPSAPVISRHHRLQTRRPARPAFRSALARFICVHDTAVTDQIELGS